MTPEQLLEPRIKIENGYPNSPFKIGEIICLPSAQQSIWANAYPHIFRWLEWHEERDEKDMPEYVKCLYSCCCITTNFSKDRIYKLSELHDRECYKWFIPATQREYLNYINKTNK